ncbi:MAG TPA: hypothetical protein VHK66_08190 [Microvirga sp.]|jgi:hypothetical protein|nr:hypothetical protein [Microvirga sp.]
MPGPDPLDPHPVPGHSRVGFLRAFVRPPRNLDAIRGSDLAALKSAA